MIDFGFILNSLNETEIKWIHVEFDPLGDEKIRNRKKNTHT